MPIIAILIDVLAAALYYIQSGVHGIYLAGSIIQAVFTIALLIITVSYRGKKYAIISPHLFWRNFSFRYAVIVMSMIVNAVLLFLYVLNLTGTNPPIVPG